ncbi:MAG: hypothetical protein ACOCRO_11510, partial [Halanaerobiales bacterium]
ESTEQEVAKEMFEELQYLAKDIDTARGVINDLKQHDNSARENITKISEIEEKLKQGQKQLLNEEDGMLHRLEAIHPDSLAEVDEEWIRSLEYKYKED